MKEPLKNFVFGITVFASTLSTPAYSVNICSIIGKYLPKTPLKTTIEWTTLSTIGLIVGYTLAHFFDNYLFAKKGYNNKTNSGNHTQEKPQSEPAQCLSEKVKKAYKTLGLPANASLKEASQARKKLLFKHHPDRGGTNENSRAINEAYDTIKQHLSEGTKSSSTGTPIINNACFFRDTNFPMTALLKMIGR